MKIVLSYMIASAMVMMTISTTVIAQDTISTDSAGCQACASGSPQIQAYISWMGEIMTTLNSVASIDQGNIAGQAYNINTKNTRSKQRNEQSSKAELEITNHAAGIASDLKLLNKLHQSLNTTANILINRKSQRTSTIDTTTKTKIQSLIIKQVGPTKLLEGRGSLDTVTTYQDLLVVLLSLHSSIAAVPQADTGYTFTRQGYTSNRTTIPQMISYYQCAQTVAVCNKSTPFLQQTSASIKGYRQDIVRAGQQIQQALSKQYRTIDAQKPTKRISMGGGADQAWSDIQDIGTNIAGRGQGIGEFSAMTARSAGGLFSSSNRKEFSTNIKNKRAAKLAQRQQQAQTLENTKRAQQAASQGGPITIPPTTTQPQQATTAQQQYNQGEINILATALNAATDHTLTHHIEVQRYAINNDPSSIAYLIPELTRQIYDTTQAIKTSNNTVVNKCIDHCKNLPGVCGSIIK